MNNRKLNILTFLAGVISSDGCIFIRYFQRKKNFHKRGHSSRTIHIKIASVELSWIKKIEKLCSEIGIKTHIQFNKYCGNGCYYISLLEPMKLYKLFSNVEEFFMGRKFQVFEFFIKHRRTPITSSERKKYKDIKNQNKGGLINEPAERKVPQNNLELYT